MDKYEWWQKPLNAMGKSIRVFRSEPWYYIAGQNFICIVCRWLAAAKKTTSAATASQSNSKQRHEI